MVPKSFLKKGSSVCIMKEFLTHKTTELRFVRRPLPTGATRLKTFLLMGFAVAAASTFPRISHAAQLYSGDALEINLDTTFEYSNDFRVNGVSANVSDKYLNVNSQNSNDGDQDFQHGMTSNRFEVTPVLEIKDGNFGIHISGETYIDTAYLQRNTNDSPDTINSFVTSNRNFAPSTVAVDGRNAQLLDAFAYDSKSFGAEDGQTITVKVGRQTLLWGQSLFFTNNGIAAGQAPIDINNALTLANPQASQVFLPVGQVVGTYQPNQWLTLQGYYQFEWRPDQFSGVGSYYSALDFFGPGADRLISALVPTPSGNLPVYLTTGHQATPGGGNGQFGLSAQFQLGNFDFGFYGLRFDAQSPEFYVYPAAVPTAGPAGLDVGRYDPVHQKDIQIYGTSLSTTVGPVNVAGELSGRMHQDFFSSPVVFLPGMNENSKPGYAYGSTLNGQISAIYLTPGLPLMPGGAAILGEVEANRVLSVTNKQELVPGRTADAIGIDVSFTPTYYEVLPNLDVNIPISMVWYPTGRSQFDNTMNAGTGVLDIGVTGTFRTVWQSGISYKDYLGSTTPFVATGASKQPLADRGNVSFYIQRTF
jgi:hypothetical protein